MPSGNDPSNNSKGRATLVDVAAAAGVSRSTASRALSGSPAISPDARAKVEAAAASLGYRPNRAAQTLRTRRTQLVGLLLNNLVNATFHVVAEVLQQRLHERGYRIILCVTGADPTREAQYLDVLADQQVDGAVVIGTGENLGRQRALARQGIAVVNLIRAGEGAPGDAVLAADHDGGYAAVDHLLQGGHRRIGYIGGQLSSNSGRERFTGFAAGLANAGAQPDDDLVVRGPFTEEFGRAAIHQLLDLDDPPSAVYVANHEAAFGVLPTLAERGISVPAQLAVVCHEDVPWFRHWHPSITVVDNGARELAGLAADRLLAGMQDADVSAKTGRTYRVGAQLVVRESSTAVPG